MGNIKAGNLEKIYTPPKLSKFSCDNVKKHSNNITEIIEPCAGDGSMLNIIKNEFPKTPIKAFDIEPNRDDIIQQNLLKTKLEYKKGRVVITNFPFQKGLKMLYKCLEISDMVVAILSFSSIMSFNYDDYELIELYGIKKQTFLNNKKYPISIFIVKNKDKK